MAEAALDEMRAFRKTSAAGSAAVTQAWLEETRANPGLCRKYAGFNHVRADPNRDAQECSDVIRLYGAFVEKAGDLNFQGYAAEKKQKDDFRTGGPLTPQNERKELQKKVWGKDPKTEFAGCGGRFRLIALIEEAAVIERILCHLHLPTEVPAPRPGRAPPLLAACSFNHDTDVAAFNACA